MHETIFAPATANGTSAISVFRFSGNGSKGILKELIKSNKIPLARKLVLKKIFNPATNELIYKPGRLKVRFRPSKKLKQEINE